MFVRPPAVRSRNTGRRPIQPRLPMNELNRPLLRQFVRNRRSDPRYEAYILEVREGPAINGNTNAAAGKSIPQPWVTVRDFVHSNHSIGLPVSVCDTLLKHLLTCVTSDESEQTDSSEENEPFIPNTKHVEAPSSADVSGDAISGLDEITSEENSPKKSPSRTRVKPFQLSRLKPIRIVCEATGCMLEVTGRDPTAKQTSTGESEHAVVPIDACRRWIVSAPLESRTTSGAEQNSEAQSALTNQGKRRSPWETRGILELHESLMAQLSAFLADVVTRYRSVNQLPEVRSLYSASGGRRFFFDLRDTRWGKRLHISQVTDLHRNVIGIPLEALCTFRARLDTVIQSLGLEDQHTLRSELYGPPMVDGAFQRDQSGPITNTTPDQSHEARDDSADGGLSATAATSGGRRSTPNVPNRGDLNSGNNRGRMHRRRVRSFTGPNINSVASHQIREKDQIESVTENQPRRSGPQITRDMNEAAVGVGQPSSRRFPRRNRNPRLFNRSRRGQPNFEGPVSGEPGPMSAGPEPAIDTGRVAPVAEASA